ncbi:hypothetical protein JXB12_04060 [candidate division KSB1 bacterium]|nr:hypothetical protein [candidate division KSB1 bacterium]
MAEGLLKKKLYPKFGELVHIHSAGTLGIDGNPATLNSVKAAAEKDIDISKHISKGVRQSHIDEADIVMVMERYHKEYLDTLHPISREKVFLLKTFYKQYYDEDDIDIDDPIGRDYLFYQKTIDEIERELDRILPELEFLIQQKLKNLSY